MLKKSNRKLIIIGGLVLYLISTGISYAAFRYLGTSTSIVSEPKVQPKGGLKVDLSAPKTEKCPLNGGMFTSQEKKIWEQRRPLTVMIENHEDSRPQSGLSRADIIYEVVAEGGITRLLAVYYCGASAEEVTLGPIRSARTYYLDFASEYGDWPLYAHVGGANIPGPANALGQIGDYGWLKNGNDMNQFAIGFPVFWRDYERIGHEVATEHTMYSTTDKLWEVAHKKGLGAQNDEGKAWDAKFEPWTFKKEASEDKRGTVAKIDFEFWNNSADYAVSWQFDKTNNVYLRSNGGAPQKDLNNDEQLQAKAVVITFMQEKGPIDEIKHMLYTTIGKGKVLVFQDGQVTEGTWNKAKRTSRTKFLDSKGKEIAFNPGQIWIEIIPAGRQVKY